MDLVLLDLQDNRLTDLPKDFLAQMVSLRKLSVNKNRYFVCIIACSFRTCAPCLRNGRHAPRTLCVRNTENSCC